MPLGVCAFMSSIQFNLLEDKHSFAFAFNLVSKSCDSEQA